MQREHLADLEDLQSRVGPKDVMHDQDALAVKRPHTHGLVRSHREKLRPRERARAEVVQVEVAVAELKELGAELILVAVRMLLDEPVGLERPEQAVDGSLGEPEALRKLAYTEASRACGE